MPKVEKKRVTKATVQARLVVVESMLAEGFRHGAIASRMKEKFSIGPRATEKLITRVYNEWKTEKKVETTKKREDQERRLLGFIRASDKMSDKARFEGIYARVAGTEAPQKIAGSDGEQLKMILEVVDYRSPDAAQSAKKR